MYTPRSCAFARATSLPRATLALAAFAASTAVAGCSDSFRGVAASHADQMVEAMEGRFAPNVYDARYNVARVKLAQSALVPSRIFEDTAVWTGRPSANTRTLSVEGAIAADGRYHFESRPTLGPVTRTGESHHVVALERLSDNQFRWDTRVDLGIGAITADEVATIANALLGAPSGHTEREVREDYRAAFPRATAAFGHGFVLDSVATAPAALGTTSVTMRFAFRPELMKATYPRLAEYLDRYLGPAKYRFILSDRSGAVLFDVTGRDRMLTARYRVQQGKLVTLLGPPRAWPDSLTLTADISLKVKVFTVGVHELVTDFVISNTSSGNVDERAWTVIAQHEPKWDLPLITERLLRSPLHRPFDGQGAMFRLSVRDSAGGQSVFGRRVRLDVQESPIMRFLGSLASRAVGDLDGSVEAEEHRFFKDGLAAVQADVRALSVKR